MTTILLSILVLGVLGGVFGLLKWTPRLLPSVKFWLAQTAVAAASPAVTATLLLLLQAKLPPTAA